MIDNILIENMRLLLAQTDTQFIRYKYTQIDWSLRMIGLVGPRGVGKSTMVLQRIKMEQTHQKPLYISADSSYFTQHTLIETAADFVKEGGTHLYIDEIHKYEDWSRELKEIYDLHPSLKIIFTGSSILDIQKGQADLSRRAITYHMQGLSFREYLQFFHHIVVDPIPLDKVINNDWRELPVEHPLPLFRHYLQEGYYPFSKEGAYNVRLDQIVTQTLETDIAQYASLSITTGRKLRRLMSIVSQSAPFKPDYTSIANSLGVSRNIVPNYLVYMERTGLIGQLRDETGGLRSLGKVEKVYLDNTNLMYALGADLTNIGNVRETFFYNQVRVVADVISSKVADFMIGNHTFEVGGKKKGQAQIAGVTNGHIVKDDIEYGSGKIIPLWAFGLLY